MFVHARDQISRIIIYRDKVFECINAILSKQEMGAICACVCMCGDEGVEGGGA